MVVVNNHGAVLRKYTALSLQLCFDSYEYQRIHTISIHAFKFIQTNTKYCICIQSFLRLGLYSSILYTKIFVYRYSIYCTIYCTVFYRY